MRRRAEVHMRLLRLRQIQIEGVNFRRTEIEDAIRGVVFLGSPGEIVGGIGQIEIPGMIDIGDTGLVKLQFLWDRGDRSIRSAVVLRMQTLNDDDTAKRK